MTFKKDSIRAIAYAALLAFAVALPVIAHADAVTPDTILANPGQYDTQTVIVTGTAKNVTTRQGRRGKMTRYDLCGTACIHVTDFTGTDVTEGATTTATGTFHAHISRGNFSLDNALMVGAPAGRGPGGFGGPGGPGGPGGGSPPPAPQPTSTP